jgi:hypothetical protein
MDPLRELRNAIGKLALWLAAIQKGRVQPIGTRRYRTQRLPVGAACPGDEEINSSLTRSPLLRCIMVNSCGRGTIPVLYLSTVRR